MDEKRSALREREVVRCPTCGYDVRGLAARVCPECGAVVTPAAKEVALARNAFERETPRIATRRLIVFGVVAAIIVLGCARENAALVLWATGWLTVTLAPGFVIAKKARDTRTRMVALLWLREFPLLHSCWLAGWAVTGLAHLIADDVARGSNSMSSYSAARESVMFAGAGAAMFTYLVCLALWSISTHLWDRRLRLELKGVPDKRLTLYLTLGMSVILLSGGFCGAGVLGAVWE